MSYQIPYISTSCNATVFAAHWGKNNLICFASCNAVLIYNPKTGGGKIIKTLCKHKNRVNTVKWVPSNEDETELISGSTDKTAIVWSLKDNKYIPSILTGHESNVNVVDGLYTDNAEKRLIVATASVDSTVRIWMRQNNDGEFSQFQVLSFGYDICLALKFTFLNSNDLILACGSADSNIHIFSKDNFAKCTIIKAHSDWVRGLDFIKKDSDILLASCSQDASIQLFKITDDDNVEGKFIIETETKQYQVLKESIIVGHEGWIYSVHWNTKHLKLLSASIDKTIIVWEYNDDVKLWLETTRLGEVGGNTLGFYGAMFGPDGESILGYSYHGAFHMWTIDSFGTWSPMVTVNGHFNEVIDIGWEPDGEFLISVSTDQTTRIHAPWKSEANEVTWHEIARPQVHGYDMSSLALLSRYKFVSSAEEKVIRAFQAPANFVQNFKRICNIENDFTDIAVVPQGASVPSLGLSNKAVYDSSNEARAVSKSNKDPYPEESYFTAIELSVPPTEETLLQNTLWPEIQKLYGHGYEVYTLAASKDGKLLASSCRATTKEHAAILLWDTSSWKQIQKLFSHTLTVAQLSFSPNCNHLLSVSRDRRWSLFTKNAQSGMFDLVATTDKKTGIHTRIIWTCSWTHDSLYFTTGSRDGKVVVWKKNESKTPENVLGQYENASAYLDLQESVTALCFAPISINNGYLLAVGMESGFIYLYIWKKEWLRVLTFDNSVAHHLTVKKLSFRPVRGKAGHKDSIEILQLASCSSDHSVRIYDINVDSLHKFA